MRRDAQATAPPDAATRRSLLGRGRALVAGVGAAAVGACGPLGTAGPTTTSQAPVTATLWDRSDVGYLQYMEAWLPLFNAKHERVHLRYEPRPPEWGEKLTAAMSAGTPPDVVAVFGPWFRTFQQQQQALPLDPFVKASRLDVPDFLQSVYRGMNWRGQQIGIPQYVNTNTVYYNRERFKQAGVPFPRDDWTHDQFLDTARRLTRGALPVREVWGLSLPWSWIAGRVLSLIWGQCGAYLDPKDPNIFTFNTPQNVRAFQWAHDLPWKHRIGAVTNADRGEVSVAEAFFATGSVAMILEGTHLLGAWKARAQTDWDVAALPTGPCGRGEYASVDGFIIPVGVKTPEASWVVIQAITDKEANRLRGEIVGLVPARKSQMEAWAKTIPGKSLRSAIATDEGRADPSALWPRASEVNGVLTPIFQALFDRNELAVPDALKRAHEAIVGLLGPSAVR